MKLSSIESRVLKRIDASFPIPFDPADESIIAIGERPLENLDSIVNFIGNNSRGECEAAVARLKTFQCIADVHIYITLTTTQSRLPHPARPYDVPTPRQPKGTVLYK